MSDEIRGRFAKARREQTVERDRRSTALDVSEDCDADFLIDFAPDFVCNLIGNAAKASGAAVDVSLFSADALRTFRDNDDVE